MFLPHRRLRALRRLYRFALLRHWARPFRKLRNKGCLNRCKNRIICHLDGWWVRLDNRSRGVIRWHLRNDAYGIVGFLHREFVGDLPAVEEVYCLPFGDCRRYSNGLACHDGLRRIAVCLGCRSSTPHGTHALPCLGINTVLNPTGHDPSSGLFLLIIQRANVIIRPRPQEHEVLRLEYPIIAIILPHIAHWPGRSRHAALPARNSTPTRSILPTPRARTRLPFDLLLRLEKLLRSKGRYRRCGIDVVGKFVAFRGEVVLDVAVGLVAVKPALAVVVPLPALWKASHDELILLSSLRI